MRNTRTFSSPLFIFINLKSMYSTVLTGRVIVAVLPLSPCAVDAQKGFVVVILIPVEGRDPGEGPFSVATEQAGGGGHELAERWGLMGLKQ